MNIRPFRLERYFAAHEFSVKYLLSCSDCETLSMSELLEMADTDTLGLWENMTLGYTESLGHPALRESIADIYQGIDPDNILVTVPEEGIFLLMETLLKPGDHVVCTFPGYQSLYELARAMGCSLSFWEPDEDQSGWHFNVTALEKMIQDDTKLIVVNFPHNPTGCLPTEEEYIALIDIAEKRDIYLFSDEMYRFLEIDPYATLPAGCELYDKAISLFGLSKSFGLPGLRIGWMATRTQTVLQKMSLIKDYTTICNSAPSEILGLIAVRNREKIISGQQVRIQKNILLLDDFFAGHTDYFTFHRPRGGSICFPRMIAEKDTLAFSEKLIKEAGIMIVPSAMFNYGNHHVRFGFGRENLSKVIRRFADYLAPDSL